MPVEADKGFGRIAHFAGGHGDAWTGRGIDEGGAEWRDDGIDIEHHRPPEGADRDRDRSERAEHARKMQVRPAGGHVGGFERDNESDLQADINQRANHDRSDQCDGDVATRVSRLPGECDGLLKAEIAENDAGRRDGCKDAGDGHARYLRRQVAWVKGVGEQNTDGGDGDGELPPGGGAVDCHNPAYGKEVECDHKGKQRNSGDKAPRAQQPGVRMDQARDITVGVGEHGDNFHWRHRGEGEKENPAPDLAGEIAVAHMRHVHQRPRVGEHGREFGENEGEEQYCHGSNDPGKDRKWPGFQRRMQCTEQPARTDNAAQAGIKKTDDADVAA